MAFEHQLRVCGWPMLPERPTVATRLVAARRRNLAKHRKNPNTPDGCVRERSSVVSGGTFARGTIGTHCAKDAGAEGSGLAGTGLRLLDHVQTLGEGHNTALLNGGGLLETCS